MTTAPPAARFSGLLRLEASAAARTKRKNKTNAPPIFGGGDSTGRPASAQRGQHAQSGRNADKAAPTGLRRNAQVEPTLASKGPKRAAKFKAKGGRAAADVSRRPTPTRQELSVREIPTRAGDRDDGDNRPDDAIPFLRIGSL